MLSYKARYKFLDDGVHGELLDFAGVITCVNSLNETDLEEPLHLFLNASSKVKIVSELVYEAV